jgi:hypothetical protein
MKEEFKLQLIVFNSYNFQGAYFAWKATAMGKNHVNGKTFLEKRLGFYRMMIYFNGHYHLPT